MAQVDISGFEFLFPILAFLLVFVVVYAVLAKTKIVGESKFVELLLSFIVAIIFSVAIGPRDYIISLVPWVAVVLISVFLIFILTGFIGESSKALVKPVGIAAVVILLIIFLVSAFYSFGGNWEFLILKEWATSSKVAGAIILTVIAALVSWVLVKAE